MTSLPRESKYRHIFHEIANNDQCYNDIKPDVFGESQHIAANTRYWAVPIIAGGGGSFMVHDMQKTGRVERNHPLLKFHTARILELSFSRFNERVIASSSDDCTVRVCNFPEQITENIMKEDVQMNGHSKKVTGLTWHPTSNNVLASSSADKRVIIWDVEAGEEAIMIEDHNDLVYSIVWNRNGRYIASSCQDRLIRIMDPRDEDMTVLTATGHENKKNSKVFWLNNRNMIGSVGFTKDSFRELTFFDIRKMDDPFHRKRLDRQNSKFFPYFEEGNDVLFLAGKGDSGIRAYEISDQEGFCHPITEVKMTEPQKGIAVLPRRALDTAKCEIFKVLRLKSSSVERVSVMVPRRNAANVFQEDIYPDCYSGKPSMSIDEYFDGVNRDPVLMSMNIKSDKPTAGGSRFRRRGRDTAKPKEEPKPKPKPKEEPKPKEDTKSKLEKRRQARLDRKTRPIDTKPKAETNTKPSFPATTTQKTKNLQSTKNSQNTKETKGDDKLKKELKETKEKLAESEKAEKKAKDDLAKAQAKSEEDNDTIKMLKQDLEKRIDQIADLKIKLDNVSDGDDKEAKEAYEKEHRRLRKARKKIKSLEKELHHSEDIINKQAENIKNLYKKISELEG